MAASEGNPDRARFRNLHAPVLTEHGLGLARRCVATHARDADDCLDLLRMLGLDTADTPE